MPKRTIASPQTKPAGNLITVILFVVLVGGAAWVGSIWTAYSQTLSRARVTTENIARLLDEHASYTFDASHLVLRRVMDFINQQGFESLHDSREAWTRVRDMAATLPQGGHLFIVGADGRPVLSTVYFPALPIDVSDREHFMAHRDGAQLFLGGIVRGKTRDEGFFTISRRLEDKQGNFLGVVVAAINPQYFTAYYEALGLDPRYSSAILRDDGKIILRRPMGETPNMADSELFRKRLLESPVGTYEKVQSAFDGATRIISYRKQQSMPLVVVSSITREAALAPWWSRLRREAAFVVVILVVLAGLTRSSMASIRRDELAARDLAKRSDELVETNARLAVALREKDKADAAKSRFLAAASHDLRQPLQATRLFIEVLQQRIQSGGDRAVVDKAAEALSGAESLLRSLLDVSTLEAGIVTPEIAEFAVEPVLRALVQECAPMAAAKGLALRAVPTGMQVRSDPVLLQRILRNLILNAVRYTEKGGILVGCRVRSGEALIEVYDTGIGISSDKFEAIFEDFYQIDNPARDSSLGLGLGLSVVKRMAALLDHRLAVRSAPGRGSVFAITLPLVGRTRSLAARPPVLVS